MTPIEQALTKFKNAVIRAWVMDTEDCFNDKNRASTREAHARANLAESELRSLIEKVGP